MKYAVRCGLMVLACGVFFAGAVLADEKDASAGDGPSRAELFEARMRAEIGSNISMLSAAAQRAFSIPADILGDAIYGIDVSHYNDENCACAPGQKCDQCKINWSKLTSQKIAFVYAKATQGTYFLDPTFSYHWRALAQQNIPRGAYHFMSADEDPLDQADYFVDKLEAAGKLAAGDLPPCLDLEADLRKDKSKKWIVVADSGEKLDFWKGQEPDDILGKILKWLNRVEQRTGRTPIIYTSRGWWMERIKDEKKFAMLKRFPIWIANYPETGSPANDSPRVPNGQEWVLWQFTDSGKMKDAQIIPGSLDVNLYRGTLMNFRRKLGVTVSDVELASAGNPVQQVASLVQNQASDASKQETPTPSVNNSQPAAPEVAKAEQQVAALNPSQAANAAAPTQQSNSASVGQPPEASAPAPQAAPANPSQAVNADKPVPPPEAAPAAKVVAASTSAPPAANANSTPPDANKSAQQAQSAEPLQAVNAEKPAQQAAPANTAQAPDTVKLAQAAPADANKSTQQAAGAPPTASQDANKPAEQTGSVNAGEQKGGTAPAPQVATVTPSDQKEAGAAGEQPANANAAAQNPGNAPRANSASRPSANRTAARAAQKQSGDKPAAAENVAAEKIMIEIDLLNGRKLRVDANIDPAVLARLIAAIDK
jgi:lysozyme